MTGLELLAPARTKEIGIAAIGCGADAVYIAGPDFGARQAAGNSIEDIKELCSYAHMFGARIFIALNTILYDNELDTASRQIGQLQEAGADAFIIQDLGIVRMAADKKLDIGIPLHASTQCAIRTVEDALFLEHLGFSRLILERQLSLEDIRRIRQATNCELEFFVHGALCVCYSGQCYISEEIAGRSSNRGACIQACRSRFDLVDSTGKTLIRNKAVLSLKDLNLKNRLEDLADAGITSFKIEGRLKNESYVKNIVREYSTALEELITRNHGFERVSFGKIEGGFTPRPEKTFNRGYTELFIDGKRGQWASMDSPKSIGEEIGTVIEVNARKTKFKIKFSDKSISLGNGDGFTFVNRKNEVTGIRGDICSGNEVMCKPCPDLLPGTKIYRNLSTAFEKELENNQPQRLIGVSLNVGVIQENGIISVTVHAESEDGRKVSGSFPAGSERTENMDRTIAMLQNQLGKKSGNYSFRVSEIISGDYPHMSASFINSMRRDIAGKLNLLPCRKNLMKHCRLSSETIFSGKPDYRQNIANAEAMALYRDSSGSEPEYAFELTHRRGAELMRSKYCIRHETGMCLKDRNPGIRPSTLYLVNNGRRFQLDFDCRKCEMIILGHD